jgi:hypothetical protein
MVVICASCAAVCFLCCCQLLRVVASRRAASLEPQLSKSYLALLLATAVDFYGSAQLISAPTAPVSSVLQAAS